MNPKRFTSSLLIGAAFAGLIASDASADSVAYIKGGDVYLSTGDGARQFQVTSGGGYDHVSQADDGTLLATTTADSHLRRLDRLGNVLSDIEVPVSNHTPSMITFQGPFDADISPNGQTAAYGFIESGFFTDPTTNEITAATHNGTGFTSSTVEKGFTDEGYKYSRDWDAPEFVDDQNVLLSNGPLDTYDDPIAVEQVGSGNAVNWFTDPAVRHPMEASINRNKSIIAAVNGPEAAQMMVYHDTNGQLGTKAGAALNVESCFTYSGAKISSPTFNAAGTRGYWSTADGLETAPFAMTPGDNGCGTAVDATTIVPGATSPDWGPADVPAGRPAAPAPAPAPAPGPKATPKPVPAPAPKSGENGGGGSSTITLSVKRVALRKALKSGLVLTVKGGGGKASATATVAGRTVATGSTTSTRLTLRFTKAAKRSLARKRKVTLKVKVARGGRTGSTSITLAR
jgi:hypothetical protein